MVFDYSDFGGTWIFEKNHQLICQFGCEVQKKCRWFFIRVTKVHFGYECHIWNLNHEQALIASWETKKGSLACEEKTFRDSPIFKANPLWNMSRVPIWKKSNAHRRGWCLLLALWTRSYMSVMEFYSMLSESNFLNVHPFIHCEISNTNNSQYEASSVPLLALTGENSCFKLLY